MSLNQISLRRRLWGWSLMGVSRDYQCSGLSGSAGQAGDGAPDGPGDLIDTVADMLEEAAQVGFLGRLQRAIGQAGDFLEADIEARREVSQAGFGRRRRRSLGIDIQQPGAHALDRAANVAGIFGSEGEALAADFDLFAFDARIQLPISLRGDLDDFG